MASGVHMCARNSPNFLKYLARNYTTANITHHIRYCTKNSIFSRPVNFLGPLCCAQQGQKLLTRNVKLVFITPTLQIGSPYSTETPEGKGLGVTDAVLKEQNAEKPPDDKEKDDKSENKKEKEKKDNWYSGKNAWKLGLLSLVGMSGLLCVNLVLVWGPPQLDAEGNEITDEFTDLSKFEAYFKRSLREFNFFKKMIQEPSSQKLLPDPLKEPYYQPPYTLVLEMTGVLVHPDWTLNTGWRFKKRPGIDYFLQQIGPPMFEIVIYTQEQGFTAFPIVDGLDPNGYVSYRLFRDATRYMNGQHVKDLGCLNRDLTKLIIVDCDSKSFQLHPRNGVLLNRWKGKDEDRTLLDLASFLRMIAMSGVEDVRTVLDHYNQFDDPIEAFKDNQRRFQEQQDSQAKHVADQDKNKSLVGGWAKGFGGRRR